MFDLPTLFDLELVGGPYDGARGLTWADDGKELALPEQLLVGPCGGSGGCGWARCAGEHLGRWDALRTPHVLADAAQYVRVEQEVIALGAGVAKYVHAEVDLSRTLEFAGVADAEA